MRLVSFRPSQKPGEEIFKYWQPLKIDIPVIPAPDYSTRGQAAAGIQKPLAIIYFKILDSRLRGNDKLPGMSYGQII